MAGGLDHADRHEDGEPAAALDGTDRHVLGDLLVYNVFQGLYYGIRSALFMDITTPAVAATQFTAYMALMNLCISYTATWQGYVVEHIGYPQTLVLDSLVGLLGLALLPLMRPRRAMGLMPA